MESYGVSLSPVQLLLGIMPLLGAAVYIYTYHYLPFLASSKGKKESTNPTNPKKHTSGPPPGWPTHDHDPLTPLPEITPSTLPTIEPTPYRPYKPMKYHMTMGLAALHANQFITLDKHYPARMHLRKQLIASKGDVVRKCLPACVEAVEEVYGYILGYYLPTKYPGLFKIVEKEEGARCFHNLVTGDIFPLLDQGPNSGSPQSDGSTQKTDHLLEILAQTIEEDILILLPDPHSKYNIKEESLFAYAACFPSGIDCPHLLGKSVKEIHGPVPKFKETIGASMGKFFPKIKVEKRWRRWNWTVTPHAELFDYPGERKRNKGKDEEFDFDPAEANLRVEYQTLTRFPRSNAILFTIRTHLTPLREIRDLPPPTHAGTEARPEPGYGTPSGHGGPGDLAEAIRGLDTDMANYKKFEVWGERVVEYLTFAGAAGDGVVRKENMKCLVCCGCCCVQGGGD
ncbi:hypothetical protein DFH27DRAFT_512422 [Peziza echinospora]|nr:hypothetical protein DFH27DRAFT_512422 [Peziza echinospora]